ncbi:type I-C CRISPR-associated protein Cas8c/Csd1 [Paramuribaculum intestinale]|uniref:type I-C CRISPR-associated protein Cas8c/Csd1 n=1 Tax=Paramuribaculum intestinale TaxID=2094151 RepID=UPI0025B6E504|nr:type I-C CRISPR-associated protein Cas8c/Csd1 [Paramuribaculum intestinale]
MILKALYDYFYSRPDRVPEGMCRKEIEYVIVIDRDGSFVRFESRRIDKKRCAELIVAAPVSRSSNVAPNVLWDNGKYVLGLNDSDDRHHRSFVGLVMEIASSHPDEACMAALAAFYRRTPEERCMAYGRDPLFDEVSNNAAANMTFMVEGDCETIAEKGHLIPASEGSDASPSGVCLVTGRNGRLVRTSTGSTIPGCSPNTALVGFQVKSGYDSYGKQQAYNSPISVEADFAYTSALKMLLSKDSENKTRLGDRTFLYWCSGRYGRDTESCFGFMVESDKSSEAKGVSAAGVEKLFKSIWSGTVNTDLDDRFYFLGLAPNAGRMAVVVWENVQLREFAGKILQHFDDMSLVGYRANDKGRSTAGVFNMLSAVTLDGKQSEALPNLCEAVVQSIIQGTRYPYQLYTSALERIRAELPDRTVTRTRASILKAYINRVTRNNKDNKQLTPMLDKTNSNPGYLSGRLAAVLEKIQSDVKSGDSIRTRYMAAASATPSAVFPAMLNLSVHHSEKLSEASRVFYEKTKQEIIEKMPAEGFPSHLDLNDQGRFFVGYYHQMADFYTKKESE